MTIPNYFDINNSLGNPLIQTVKLNKKINSVFAAAKLTMMDIGLSMLRPEMTGLQLLALKTGLIFIHLLVLH